MAISNTHMQAGSDPAASALPGDSPTVVDAGAGGPLTLPSASFIADGQFVRAGSDLVITDADGHEVVVQGYFADGTPPDLLSPDGAQHLTPGLVDSFMMPMAPGQYAQAAPTASAAPIGQVVDLDGEAFAVRADGTRIQLVNGDSVYEGDVVQTGGGHSAVRMVFTDHTEFSLGNDARLALDQLVFNPDTQSGVAQFSVLKGVFIFASGQIAKADNTDMVVTTPVATIGIRGTEVAGRVANADSQFTIIHGVIEVTTQAGSVTLDDRGETTQVAGNDVPPSDPVVLTAAQFGQAYGSVSGVVSGYFSPAQPGGVPGDGGPSVPGDGSPDGSHDTAPSGSGDHADSGAAPGDKMLASALPADSPTVTGLSDPAALADAFTISPETISGPSSVTSSQTGFVDPLTGIMAASIGAAGLAGTSSDAGVSASGGTGVAPDGTQEIVVAGVPGLDLGGNLTFEGTSGGGQTGAAGGFSLAPSGDVAPVAVAGAGPDDGSGAVQVAFTPVPGPVTSDAAGLPGGTEAVSTDSPPLDMPSTGDSGSPFRADTGSSDLFTANPYVSSTAYGYAGPQLGDAAFTLVASGSGDADAGPIAVGDDPFLSGAATPVADTSPPADTPPADETPPVVDPAVAGITLTVSNATTSEQTQDLTNSYVLPDEGPDSFVLIGGSGMGLPGVSNSASITLARDESGNVDVALTSGWNSVKNIRAESDTAGDIHIANFVHADVSFGNGGDSDITIIDAKRGFITTGDGDDTISIKAVSNGAGWSNIFDVSTGAGDDVVTFEGASGGLSVLKFDGGAGTDTLRLTGPDQSFDLTAGQIEVTGVERVDISGTGGNATLTLSSTLFDGQAANVNDLTGTSQTLVVDGNAGDTLNLQGAGWSADGTTDIGGESYAIYHNADTGMTVAADSHISVT